MWAIALLSYLQVAEKAAWTACRLTLWPYAKKR